MKARNLTLLCLLVSLALSSACASNRIGGFNLNKLADIQEGEGLQIDAYIQQEGYVYKMLDVLEPPKASEASGADL